MCGCGCGCEEKGCSADYGNENCSCFDLHERTREGGGLLISLLVLIVTITNSATGTSFNVLCLVLDSGILGAFIVQHYLLLFTFGGIYFVMISILMFEV
jgi:hypothetical protein